MRLTEEELDEIAERVAVKVAEKIAAADVEAARMHTDLPGLDVSPGMAPFTGSVVHLGTTDAERYAPKASAN